ncbi:MAG: Gfo/Idh/MocA family oxidoreductase [Polyangiales bacterium]
MSNRVEGLVDKPEDPARIGIVGTGFVADLYMRSLELHPELHVIGAHDSNADRLRRFSTYWKVPQFESLGSLLESSACDLVLNLTNPGSHYEVNRQCLSSGVNVYSEKPLATDLSEARGLHALARERNLLLASAPCNFLSESPQIAWRALRAGLLGQPRLIYAELDDGFISQAAYQSWRSESGAPWPYRDEFQVGCTLEHAGYYLTWLVMMFGSVRRVAAAAACLVPEKGGESTPNTPDFSVGVLYFDTGVVARLTCSIVAAHDHRFRVIGDRGVMEVTDCWDNESPVVVKRRVRLRRRLIDLPIGRRERIRGHTHPKVRRRGAASMNFALGPAEMMRARRESRTPRVSADMALHINEVTLALQEAVGGRVIEVQSSCPAIEPMPWARDS